MIKVWIFSLKHAPGLLKEIRCLENCFENEGLKVKSILHFRYKEFEKISSDQNLKRTTYLNNLKSLYILIRELRSSQPKSLFFYNSHPLNLLFMFLGLIFCRKSRRVLILHEPNKINIFKNFGLYGIVVSLIIILNKFQSWFCSDLIVLSPYGKKLIENSIGYNNFCKIHQARIFLPPLVDIDNNDSIYVSFLGNVNTTKGIDWFLDLVDYATSVRANLKFAIISGSKLNKSVIERAHKQRDSLSIFNPKILTDFDISSWLQRSTTVLSLHRSVTQSGVFVECARHGVPSIVLNETGFTQFIENSGVIVEGSSDPKELLFAVNLIISKNSHFKESTKKVYEENFNPYNFKKFYSDFIGPQDNFN